MNTLSGKNWSATITPTGQIGQLKTSTVIDFRSDQFAGPTWYGEWDSRYFMNAASTDKLAFSLRYEAQPESLVIYAGIRNTGNEPFRPVRCGLRLGLDTYMEKYPDWNRKLFPTLLRCERTHFWGYCMSPDGTILGIASPDPVASWSLQYNRAKYGDWGHRIYTLNLDLMNALPLPARHPHIDELLPGEERTWRIHLVPVSDLASLKPALAKVCGAPMFDIDRLTVAPGEPARVHTIMPDGKRQEKVHAYNEPGLQTLVAEANGKRSEAKLFVRKPWSWYLQQARRESIRVPQKASTHVEGWLGLYTQLLARRYFPDAALDAQAEAKFNEIVPQMYDLEKKEPIRRKPRIFNTAYMAGVFVARYRCTGDVRDLEIASVLTESIMEFQQPSGAYFGSAGGRPATVHYTCVGYPAKSILEVAAEEKKLTEPKWRERYERHMRSVKAAMDDLVRQLDNIDTEGEITFEDGMISCASAQLGMFALLQDDPTERKRYADAAGILLHRHACLEQLLIPDCRMNGATLRFWEAQYDVLLYPNMMNSPHGWTSWKTYATWYLYQLTGDEALLTQTMNTLGACMQTIDIETGKLRWGFVPDPYIRADQFGDRTHRHLDGKSERVFIEDPARPGSLEAPKPIIGEQYVDMISDKYAGWCCDNDVHEHFKCLEEVALTSAYVIERTDGSLAAWNCRAVRRDNVISILPAEAIVSLVHVNMPGEREIEVRFTDSETVRDRRTGLSWIKQVTRNP